MRWGDKFPRSVVMAPPCRSINEIIVVIIVVSLGTHHPGFELMTFIHQQQHTYLQSYLDLDGHAFITHINSPVQSKFIHIKNDNNNKIFFLLYE